MATVEHPSKNNKNKVKIQVVGIVLGLYNDHLVVFVHAGREGGVVALSSVGSSVQKFGHPNCK